MEKMKFSGEDLAKLKKLGAGAIAEVYKLSEELVLKVFKKMEDDLLKEDAMADKVGIENDTCVFPKSLAEIDGEYKGYVMQFIDGEMLGDVAKKIDFEVLIPAIQRAEKDIKELSKDKIMFADVNQGSLMWTKDNRIKVIDTDFFHKVKDKDVSEEEVSKHNMGSFYTMLEMETGLLNGPINDFLNDYNEYKKCYAEYMKASVTGKPVSITTLYLKAIEIFQKEFGITPRNIEEMELILKEHNLYKEPVVTMDSNDQSIQGSDDIPIFEPPTKPHNHTARAEEKATHDLDEI